MEIEKQFKLKFKKSWLDDFAVFWRLIKEHRLRLILALLCSLAISGINGAIAWAVKPAMDEIFVKKSIEFLYLIPIGVLALFSLRGIFMFCNNYLMSSIGAKIVRTIRDQIYDKILKLPLSFFCKDSSGNIISRVLNDVELLKNTVSYTIKDFFVEGLTVIVLAGVAFYRRWDLALLSFVVIPIMIFTIAKLGKKLKEIGMKTRFRIAKVTTLLHETLHGLKIIKAYTMEKDMIQRHKGVLQDYYRNIMREVRTEEFTRLLTETIAGVGVAMIVFYGGYLVVTEKISSGDFFSFITAVMLMYTPLRRLSKVNASFQLGRNVIERLRDIIFVDEEVKGGLEKNIQGSIVFKNVSFKYPLSKDYALKDINLEIKPGETVAIVGPSGAGKSTIADLIAGFWYPTEGDILIDGVSIREISLQSLRSQIALVTQEIILFNDSVMNNIKFGNISSTDEEVEQAAKIADAHDFIMKLPKNYDSVVGEKGVLLSGGQKQRITIARAILRDPKILIFDEATASLDTESEEKIQKALERIRKGRTTIVIAHRLSTIKRADKIIVMDKGRIIEQGTHEELLALQGLYSELWHSQFGVNYL
ncbi:MAG: ABC transporter ATP-binding protein [Thermodesulfovibrio sp.]|uniref:ABC transporter ATP-binding protein n=1 Tax=unclassified Thermodesulfovibrio TaxID=2645936 RepID=UPI000857951F|nr:MULTISPECIES: ABC transporter ATP-binding protein [unclassified Thermodesulfovibrio]MDI1471841.1 ABC transporter ATP-binding protein [Thermodesulfovibrio sp. 1176]MDI6713731.1 ABC transporter ATP-binding protein [Thermodesulfovibrio sp.]ODA44834.1 Lipid A export ATP-binding/permease protein MsbA [Thermodesulfovibrio sp. N1]